MIRELDLKIGHYNCDATMLLFITVCLTLLLVIFFLLRNRSHLENELLNLDHRTRSLFKGESSANPGNTFGHKISIRIWNRILSAHLAGSSRDDTANPALILNLSSAVAAKETELLSCSEKATELLLNQAGPFACSCAVILFNGLEKRFDIKHIRGTASSQLNSTLCHLPSIYQPEQNTAGWNLVSPIPNSPDDLSSFGIGLSFISFFQGDSSFRGAIWLGYRLGAPAPSHDKLLILHALTRYCGASLSAALINQKTVMDQQAERDILLALSHDLRAPSLKALEVVRLLNSTASNNLSQLVEESLLHQLELLGNVFDVIRARKQTIPALKIPLDIRNSLSSIVKKYRPQFDEKMISLKLSLTQNCYAIVDPIHFDRIVSNLVSNALKYTDHGSVEISCRTEEKRVSVTISDTGIGIPKGEEELLFAQFSRLSNAGRGNGLGLGLSLAHALAEANNGFIRYESVIPQGSIFSLYLPAIQTSTVQNNYKVKDTKQRSVLIIDDEPTMSRAVCRILEPLDLHTVCAATNKEVCDLLDTQEFDLIITDVNLREDIEFKHLEIISSLVRTVPVIVLTGSSDTAHIPIARHTPVTFLEKPVTKESLLSAVKLTNNNSSNLGGIVSEIRGFPTGIE